SGLTTTSASRKRMSDSAATAAPALRPAAGLPPRTTAQPSRTARSAVPSPESLSATTTSATRGDDHRLWTRPGISRASFHVGITTENFCKLTPSSRREPSRQRANEPFASAVYSLLGFGDLKASG